MFCKYCGAELTDGSVFCSKCGKKILSIEENTESENNQEKKVNNEDSEKIKSTLLAVGVAIVLIIGIVIFGFYRNSPRNIETAKYSNEPHKSIKTEKFGELEFNIMDFIRSDFKSIIERNVTVLVSGVPYSYYMTNDIDAMFEELEKQGFRTPTSEDFTLNPALSYSVRKKMEDLDCFISFTTNDGIGVLNIKMPHQFIV